MADEEQVLKDAYRHFANWPNERQQFEALLDPNVHWVETDHDLGAGNYQGRAEVMAHLDQIQQQLASATLVSVSKKPQGWEAQDNMQVQGHDLHCCITDIDFTGDLITRVVHCRAHVDRIDRGPCG